MPTQNIVIIGGAAAGLAAAGALRQRGFNPLVLEADRRVGGVWERRYDRLHLHTVFSSLPYLPLPRQAGRYPSKDAFAAYLRAYVRHFQIKLIAGCRVQRVSPAGTGWLVESSCGSWQAQVVVIATGQYSQPYLPDWPGRAAFQGELLHSAAYRNASAYAGKRVLVVGLGNSGAEIASELAEAGEAVAVSVRSVPPITLRDPFGMPVQRTSLLLSNFPPRLADTLARATMRLTVGDLTAYGLPTAQWLPYSSLSVPVIDVGFIKQLKARRVQVRPALARLNTNSVEFSDGSVAPFDVVIAATGFRTGLAALLDAPGALNEHHEPAFASGAPTNHPGLYFVGFTHSLRGHLYEASRAALRLAHEVQRYLT